MMSEHGVRPCRSSALRQPSVVLLLLCVVMATGKILTIDPKCLEIGGMCVDLNSCPPMSRSNESGLCDHQEQGVGVCCHGVSSDASCRQKGGRCGQIEECRNVPNFGQLDCNEGSNCCLLIF